MVQNILLNQYNNKMEKEFINLFHKLGIPLRTNSKGRKGYSNYQRISTIILFARSRKSLRDFVKEFYESKWLSWLDMQTPPSKSTLHNWLKYFSLKIIRRLNKFLQSKNITIGAIDGTGIDSFHRSRHYEKRLRDFGEVKPIPNAKADLFVDITTKKIIDFSLVNKHQHDVVAAKQFVKRNKLKGMKILCDKGYDCEPLHREVFEKGGRLYAPVRKSSRKHPKGWFRRQCVELPDFMGQRSIVESVNGAFKRRRLHSLRSKNGLMKKKEFAWHVLVYNLEIEVANSCNENVQTKISFFILISIFH